MSVRTILLATAIAVPIAAAALAAPHGKKAAPSAVPTEAEQLVRNCNAHKFETVVQELVDGQPHRSKVKLCGKEGQTDAEWIGTLEDAAAKVKADDTMPSAVRDQIVAALDAEIKRVKTPLSLVPRRSAANTSVIDALPPLSGLPQTKSAEASALPRPRQAPSSVRDDYAALPPLSPAPPPVTHVLTSAAAASVPALPRPRMSIACYDVGQAEGPCTGFTRDTTLIVRAGEDIPIGTSLRFVRDGNPKADVALAQLRKGRSVELKVPADVCRHVVGGRLELRIVRSGQEVGTEGPFNLNC